MKEWQQKLIPQHTLSRMLGRLANAKCGRLTHFFIRKFTAHYNVNLSEAKITNVSQFASFNDFFTRELKEGARTIVKNDRHLISPVDGCISEMGPINEGRLLQAKGAFFSLLTLCAGDKNLASHFDNGSFLTAYLSPKDYHRFHMPYTGRLLEMIYVPGDLFSVNRGSVRNVPELFARNERVICVFETAIGKMAVIAVGAMIVGSIAMTWHGVVAPDGRSIQHWVYDEKEIQLQQGDEMGRFLLGSTIIVLCEKDQVNWIDTLKAESHLLLGQVIGEVKTTCA